MLMIVLPGGCRTAPGANEQQTAMTVLAQNVDQVASMTEQSVAIIRQTEGMTDSLANAVERMRKAVAQYSV